MIKENSHEDELSRYIASQKKWIGVDQVDKDEEMRKPNVIDMKHQASNKDDVGSRDKQ